MCGGRSVNRSTRVTREPERLLRGKEFHRRIQEDWEQTAEGDVAREKRITKPSGRGGRIDVHVRGGDNVAVVEIKASDWDRMSDRAVRRNVRRQIRQIWSYIESQLEDSGSVSPGVIFPKRPCDPARRSLIEEIFYDDGIVVVWDEE